MGADPHQVILALIAVLIMIGVPVLCHLSLDALAGRWQGRLAGWWQRRLLAWRAGELGHLVAHRREVRALRRQRGVPIEQVAADIRRLRARLGQDDNRSAVQQIGARIAYDQVLIQACTMVGVEHALQEGAVAAVGIDREIERIRVEAALQDCGFVLTDHRFGQAA